MKLPNNPIAQHPNIPIAELPNDPITQLPNNLPVIFFGSSAYVLPIIEVLKQNFNLSLVVTTEKPPNLASQGEALRTPVIDYCTKNKIPYLSASSSSDLIHHSSFIIHHSSLAVLADFGLIIPQSILNMFPKGIINIHPSLLPKYRGPTPVQTAILNGDKVTGVSIMKLDEEIDHGPILAKAQEEILDTDTSESLYERLFEKGANLLPKILVKYLKGDLKLQAQNHAKSTFTKSLTRQNGYIDPNSPPNPKTLNLMIRAYFPWPGVWFKTALNGSEKIVKLLPNYLKSQYPNDPILIQVEGKKPVSYKDFLNGYPEAKTLLKNIFSASI